MEVKGQFLLDPKLENDSFYISSLKLCELRLINNADYIWLILVPKIKDIIEITDLTGDQYSVVCNEIRYIAQLIQNEFGPDKLNIASIGNIVSQLHIHIIGRYKDDKLFPKPVWGHDFNHYPIGAAEKIISQILKALEGF